MISLHCSRQVVHGWLSNCAVYADCRCFFRQPIEANSHFLITLSYTFYKLLVARVLIFSLLVFKWSESIPSKPSLQESRFCWLVWPRWCSPDKGVTGVCAGISLVGKGPLHRRVLAKSNRHSPWLPHNELQVSVSPHLMDRGRKAM